MKARFLTIVILCTGFMACPVSVSAHHSFIAEFDRNKSIEVTGIVSNVEWMNPHARIYVEGKDETGEAATWNFELVSPNMLMRQGWRRDSLKRGDTVTVKGWRARNDPHVGSLRTIHREDGTQLFNLNREE
jgi:hypothetical protein